MKTERPEDAASAQWYHQRIIQVRARPEPLYVDVQFEGETWLTVPILNGHCPRVGEMASWYGRWAGEAAKMVIGEQVIWDVTENWGKPIGV